MSSSLRILLLVSISAVVAGALPAAESTSQRVQYEPTWESLDRHKTPEWLKDAKLGLFVYPPHPTQAEWDAYWQKQGVKDKKPYLYDGAGWDKAKWDAEDLAQLVQDMGAKYVVLCADPVSRFLIFPSRFADIEGSPFAHTGEPGRDYVDEVGKAIRKRGLRFGLYRNYHRPAMFPFWMETMKEMIDQYQPATLWLDEEKLSFPAEELRSKELLAYYYNHSLKQDEVACEDALGSHKVATWALRQDHGDWYRKECSAPATEISDGYYVRYEELCRNDNRSPVGRSRGWVKNNIDWLVHCASHGGNLELAIWLSPDEFYQTVKRPLRQIGDWLKVNGEAIYDTRPWVEGKPQDKTPDGIDVRFTTKGDSLYVILLDWPAGSVVLPHLAAAQGSVIELLGRAGQHLDWKQSKEGLTVSLATQPRWIDSFSAEIPCDHAYSLKITPKPKWSP